MDGQHSIGLLDTIPHSLSPAWHDGHPCSGYSHVGGEDADDFCDYLLDRDRWWPVVVATPPLDGNLVPLGMDRLRDAVDDMAEVAFLEKEATFILRERLGSTLACYGGAIRVIPPLGSGSMLPSNLFTLVKLRGMGFERAASVLRLVVRDMASAASSARVRQGMRRPRERLGTVSDGVTPDMALAQATLLCPWLEFLPTARESAAHSSYRWGRKLLRQLIALDATAGEMFDEDAGGQDWRTCARRHGVDWKVGISATTLGMYGDHYRFGPDGTLYEQHVTLIGRGPANCISIHMRPQAALGKLDIAYVGSHLPYVQQ